eukprot:Em0007g776a
MPLHVMANFGGFLCECAWPEKYISLIKLLKASLVYGHIVRGDRCLKDYGFRLSQARVDSAEGTTGFDHTPSWSKIGSHLVVMAVVMDNMHGHVRLYTSSTQVCLVYFGVPLVLTTPLPGGTTGFDHNPSWSTIGSHLVMILKKSKGTTGFDHTSSWSKIGSHLVVMAVVMDNGHSHATIAARILSSHGRRALPVKSGRNYKVVSETIGEEWIADLIKVLIEDRKSRDAQFEGERKRQLQAAELEKAQMREQMEMLRKLVEDSRRSPKGIAQPSSWKNQPSCSYIGTPEVLELERNAAIEALLQKEADFVPE